MQINNFNIVPNWLLKDSQGRHLHVQLLPLLAGIDRYGKLTAAADDCQLSYRHAWKLVESMNRQSRSPVVEKTTGGRGGGGAVLTEAGERAIECFWAVHREFKQFLAERSRQLDL